MCNLKFRKLETEEIEIRPANATEKGVFLLLYKDARCDQNILDETVGPMNWQRTHSRDNANCTISIWDEAKKQWISKEDTGTESYGYEEKGKASDSFKRAAFNWGIGRELYSAPKMWVTSDKCKIVNKNEKFYCNDKFYLKNLTYYNDKIKSVTIKNGRTKELITFENYFKSEKKSDLTIEDASLVEDYSIGDISEIEEPVIDISNEFESKEEPKEVEVTIAEEDIPEDIVPSIMRNEDPNDIGDTIISFNCKYTGKSIRSVYEAGDITFLKQIARYYPKYESMKAIGPIVEDYLQKVGA